ncbi:hypothetical protein QJS04_geneDACA014293 [Acorus gramineus]|uniref:Uncharacterized protein n=1 Tax=Acorus gramineus TaxID=55184 RepID=A0AAV9BUL4_ACOGR|nr:hypothetical protein QJS04_geneDACA014293 [Acorus gramineus]
MIAYLHMQYSINLKALLVLLPPPTDYLISPDLHVKADLRVKCPGGGSWEALVRQGDGREGGTDVAKVETEAGEREGSVR